VRVAQRTATSKFVVYVFSLNLVLSKNEFSERNVECFENIINFLRSRRTFNLSMSLHRQSVVAGFGINTLFKCAFRDTTKLGMSEIVG
jgi:hypothetical protein